jgi:glyoxalase family protein
MRSDQASVKIFIDILNGEKMSITGIHHITLVCQDAQRTVDFYNGVLGLRLVKKTVNFDQPTSYHLYFGNQAGQPGSVITFFEWPDAPKGSPGIGGTHHFALRVADETGLLKWKRRLSDLGIPVSGPFVHLNTRSIFFQDPDGVNLEIVIDPPAGKSPEFSEFLPVVVGDPTALATASQPGDRRLPAESWPEPVSVITPEMALSQGMHHITAISANLDRTHAFYSDLLGMRLIKQGMASGDHPTAHWYWGVEDGAPGTLISYIARNPLYDRRYRMGAGQTHHFALAVPDEATQLDWREKLLSAGLRVSPVMDRIYFKSIYTNDPDGHIVELATLGPGFSVDETFERLGTALKLPPWLESYRSQIEPGLQPLHSMAYAVA